jgi:hypothetical protein
MAEPNVGTLTDRRGLVSWPAIFAGTFVFLAIEVTFGVLGIALFSAPNGVWSGGAGAWLIVLSIIAMYIGARAAGHLGAVERKLSGVYHGLATFGVSVFAAIVIAALVLMTTYGGQAATVAQQTATPTSIISVVSTAGWWLVWALCGAFIAACIGGGISVPRAGARVSEVPAQRAA